MLAKLLILPRQTGGSRAAERKAARPAALEREGQQSLPHIETLSTGAAPEAKCAPGTPESQILDGQLACAAAPRTEVVQYARICFPPRAFEWLLEDAFSLLATHPSRSGAQLIAE